MSITHLKVSAVADEGDTDEVQPSDWNAAHTGFPAPLSTQLTAVQVKALATTPVTLVAALGGRNYVVPIRIIAHFRANAVPLDGDLALAFGWGATSAELNAAIGFTTELTTTGAVVDLYGIDVQELYQLPAAAIENKPFTVGNQFVDPTVGDGTLTIRLYYDVIDGAP